MSYINRMEVECYSKETIKSYKKYCNDFVIFSGGDLSQEHIMPYLTYLSETGSQPSTINVARCALVYMFSKVLNKPITILIPKQRVKHKEPNPVSRANIKLMKEAEKDIEKRLLIELAFGSGLRRSELLNLKWRDIDFEQERIRVVEGKGRKDRIVPLSQDAKIHLLILIILRQRCRQCENKFHISVNLLINPKHRNKRP